jgi:hypothetical protein
VQLHKQRHIDTTHAYIAKVNWHPCVRPSRRIDSLPAGPQDEKERR